MLSHAYLERDVLVWRTGVEAEDSKTGMIRLLQVVLWGILAVDKVRVEHVELVSLWAKVVSESEWVQQSTRPRRKRRDQLRIM